MQFQYTFLTIHKKYATNKGKEKKGRGNRKIKTDIGTRLTNAIKARTTMSLDSGLILSISFLGWDATKEKMKVTKWKKCRRPENKV